MADENLVVVEETLVSVIETVETRITVTGDDEEFDLVETTEQVVITATDEVVDVVEVVEAGPPGPPGREGPAGPRGDSRVTLTAATTLSGHRVVTTDSDGLAIYASPDDPDACHGPLWLTLNATVADGDLEAIALGPLEEPSWAWTPRQPLYLGDDGALTQTPPGPSALFIVQVAVAHTGTRINFDPSVPIVLTP